MGRLNKRHVFVTVVTLVAMILVTHSIFSYATFNPANDGISIDYGTTTINAKDFLKEENKNLDVKFVSKPTAKQLKNVGTYPVTIEVDERTFESKVTVVDKVKPEITIATDITVAKGSTVAYKTGVQYTDNTGAENVTLTVDNSNVDINKIGTYKLTYIATDKSGNKATKTVKVRVVDPSSAPATADQVYAKAKEILAKITNSSMTKRQIAVAIYNWQINNLTYFNAPAKASWEEGAWQGFTTGRGDCYVYYSTAKALFDVAGLENMALTGVHNKNHYWNYVKVEEGWYHFYGHPSWGSNLCLKTDAFMKTYANAGSKPGQFLWRQKNKPASGK